MSSSKADARDVLREFLKSRGLRLTTEREAVLQEVSSRRGHFDLEEIFIALRKSGAKVSRASIYRTLPLLAQSGLVEEVERTDKHAHYEYTLGAEHHDHMLCTGCGRVIEFHSGQLERLQVMLQQDLRRLLRRLLFTCHETPPATSV